MAQTRWNNLLPLGKISVTAGTPVSLAINCGSQQGQVGLVPGTTQYAPLPGMAPAQLILTADHNNTNSIYVLPRGFTAAANPGLILAAIAPGTLLAFPSNQSQCGLLPENFVIDADTGTGIVYGVGFFF